jgi:hypothetical protein
MQADRLIFDEDAVFTIATNHFVRVPIILQADDAPLIEFVKDLDASYTAQFKICNKDGAHLATVKGTQIYDGKDAKAQGVALRHFPGVTACELNGQTVFEVRREKAAALKAQAELYTPTGGFIKADDHGVAGQLLAQASGDALTIGGLTMQGCTINGCRIGILVSANGSVSVGVNRPLVLMPSPRA